LKNISFLSITQNRNLWSINICDSYPWIWLQYFFNYIHVGFFHIWVQSIPNTNICCHVNEINNVEFLGFVTPQINVVMHLPGQQHCNLIIKFIFWSTNITYVTISFDPAQVRRASRSNIWECNEVTNLRFIFSYTVHFFGSVLQCSLIEQGVGIVEVFGCFHCPDFAKRSLRNTPQAWRQITMCFLNQCRKEWIHVFICWQERLWNLWYLRKIKSTSRCLYWDREFFLQICLTCHNRKWRD